MNEKNAKNDGKINKKRLNGQAPGGLVDEHADGWLMAAGLAGRFPGNWLVGSEAVFRFFEEKQNRQAGASFI